ncbi:ribonuclease III [Corynebacterium uterequi]|uniref:Ribonuclease 3 n=1 Tax=Corynebacterium uterequi TaxID=1072256 RepID=A0A0G3HF85_9CORY|nr:ribonuclease III [Corynebacterium uterequi]AKK11400.1 RNAse III [Corynebacterium uterequi]
MSNAHLSHGEVVWHRAFDSTDHAPLLKRLGVELEPERLRRALTHRSFANEHGYLPNNERLEFVGDAVLGLSVATKLLQDHPSRSESDISKMRASLVSRYALAEIAREIKLGEHVLLGKGEAITGGADKDSILSDTFEALLGAVYEEHGFETARQMVLRLFAHRIANASPKGRRQDWKTALQVRLSEGKVAMAHYQSTSEGPDHDRVYTSEVTLDDRVLGIGVGRNKKLAEQEAARNAWHAVRDNPALLHEGENREPAAG